MMDLRQFVKDVNDAVGWRYVSPGGTGRDCSRSGIDCSGLLVRAYRLQGVKLYHGSNHLWRHGLTDKGRLTDAGQLFVGAAVFRWRKDGEPAGYRGDGQGNFYHVGVVTGLNPLVITHASSAAGRVVQEKGLGKWSHWGRLRELSDRMEEKEMMKRYRVSVCRGWTVNMRRKPSIDSDVIARVPHGEVVESADSTAADWCRVQWGSQSGYIRSAFLKAADDSGQTLTERVEQLEKRVAVLEGGRKE